MTLADRIHILSKLRRLTRTILTRWPLLLIGLAIGLAIGIWRAQHNEDLYRATSKIGATVQATTADKSHLVEEQPTYWANQINLLHSHTVSELTKKRLAKSWTNDLPQKVNLMATQAPGTSILMLSVESTDWRYAQAYAAAWAESFIEHKEDLRGQAISRAAGQTQVEIHRLEGQHEAAKLSLLAFQQTNDIAAASGARAQLERATADLAARVTERRLLESLTREDVVGINSHKPSGDQLLLLQSEQLAGLTMELRGKQAEIREWETKMKPANPFLKQLKTQAQTLQDQIDWQVELVEKRRHARIASLAVEESSYGIQLEELRQKSMQASRVLTTLDVLTKAEREAGTVLAAMRARLEAVEQTSASEERLHLLEKGVVETEDNPLDLLASAVGGHALPRSVGPSKSTVILKATIGGVGAALLLIIWFHANDKRIQNSAEAEEKLEEPVIGELPPTIMRSPKLAMISAPYAEAVRGLRNTLVVNAEATGCSILMVTSTAPAEGKTTMTAHLGVALAAIGKRVMLIDVDLRRGILGEYFPDATWLGLDRWLADNSWSGDFYSVYSTMAPMSGVHVLGTRTTSVIKQPAEALYSAKLANFIKSARDHFDYILIDAPPVGAVDDAAALLRHVDSILYVIRAGRTPSDVAATTLNSLRARNAKIAGLVMIGADADERDSYRSHYYEQYRCPKTKPAVAARMKLNFGRSR